MGKNVKTAIIMAAGVGSRFGEKTELIPKGFIDVCGKPMIIRSIETLLNCGIERIVIGTGYKHEVYNELKNRYNQIECCYSEFYATTNSMWTLNNCRGLIGEDSFLLLESDLVFEKRAIEVLLNSDKPDILLAANETKFQDQYFIEYDSNNYLTNCSTDREDLTVCGEFVGIHKISNLFYQELCNYYNAIKEEKPKLGYEYALLHIAKTLIPLNVHKVEDLIWYEIDDEEDLKWVEKMSFMRITS